MQNVTKPKGSEQRASPGSDAGFGIQSQAIFSLADSTLYPGILLASTPSTFDQIPQTVAVRRGFAGVIGKQLTAVDGSVFKTAVRVASLAWLPSKGKGKNKSTPVDGYRMHAHFEILRGIPERIDATPAKPKGKDDEKAVLASVLQPDRCSVTDRGYAKFDLFNQINAIGSSYICRARDNSTPKILGDRELTEVDRQAGVCLDRDVVLGAHTANSKTVATDHAVRYTEIEVPPHVRTGKGGSDSDGRLRLVRNLTDVPAELIAEAYRLRWLIELFFRMIKQLLRCRHLLSTKPGGVEIQMYLAIIACLLILIYTGYLGNYRCKPFSLTPQPPEKRLSLPCSTRRAQQHCVGHLFCEVDPNLLLQSKALTPIFYSSNRFIEYALRLEVRDRERRSGEASSRMIRRPSRRYWKPAVEATIFFWVVPLCLLRGQRSGLLHVSRLRPKFFRKPT